VKWYLTVALPYVTTREQAERIQHQAAMRGRLEGWAVNLAYPANLVDYELSFQLEEKDKEP